MSLATMNDLLVHELRDLYHAEGQILKALPKLAEQVSNKKLASALTAHVEETELHRARLEECFEALGLAARGKRCQGMEGLLTEGSETAEEAENGEARDAAIIGACQKVEHYEMSGYGTARAFAENLGLEEVAARLQETLEEESTANERLTEIAESEVNAMVKETNGEPASEKNVTGSADRSKSKSKSSDRVTSSRRRRETSSRRK